jgi:hypothetical protein
MSAEEPARVGTPCYTTRADGTGLGVVLARAAVRQHGGDVRIESAPGAGTAVTIALPHEARGRTGLIVQKRTWICAVKAASSGLTPSVQGTS